MGSWDVTNEFQTLQHAFVRVPQRWLAKLKQREAWPHPTVIKTAQLLPIYRLELCINFSFEERVLRLKINWELLDWMSSEVYFSFNILLPGPESISWVPTARWAQCWPVGMGRWASLPWIESLCLRVGITQPCMAATLKQQLVKYLETGVSSQGPSLNPGKMVSKPFLRNDKQELRLQKWG